MWLWAFGVCGLGAFGGGGGISTCRLQLVAQARRHLVHEAVVVALGQKVGAVGHEVEQYLQPFLVGLGEVAEHMAVHDLVDAMRTRR